MISISSSNIKSAIFSLNIFSLAKASHSSLSNSIPDLNSSLDLFVKASLIRGENLLFKIPVIS